MNADLRESLFAAGKLAGRNSVSGEMSETPVLPFRPTGDAVAVSFVIPVHEEAENIGSLYAELRCVLDGLSFNGSSEREFAHALSTPDNQSEPTFAATRDRLAVEVIFIDDGSRDGTWAEIVKIMKIDSRVHAARLRCRKGKAAALDAGFRLARGDYIVTLDGDGQDDPNEIPKLLAVCLGNPAQSRAGSASDGKPRADALKGQAGRVPYFGGYDVVCGWKQKRCDPWLNVLGSRIFNWLIGRVYGLKLHDHNCGLKCFRAEAVKDLRLFGELHRFITVLAHCQGFRVTEVPVRHRPRKHGRSKYGAFKAVEGMLDLFVVRLMTRFLEKPFHLLGTLGFGIGGLGFAGLAYLAAYWFLGLGAIGGRPLLIYSTVAVLFGTQLIALGITAELINWRLSEKRHDVPRRVSGKDYSRFQSTQ